MPADGGSCRVAFMICSSDFAAMMQLILGISVVCQLLPSLAGLILYMGVVG